MKQSIKQPDSTIRRFFLNEAAERGFAFAQAVINDGLIHVSGTLSVNDDFAVIGENDMALQLQTVYQRIEATLQAHAADFHDVLKETVFVTDMEALLANNGVRATVYGDHVPACTVVEISRLAFPACMVEIELVARLAKK